MNNEWDWEELKRGELNLGINTDTQTYLANKICSMCRSIDSSEQWTTTTFWRWWDRWYLLLLQIMGNVDDYFYSIFGFWAIYLVTRRWIYHGKAISISFFYDSKVEEEREVIISILGVDQDFYNYIDKFNFSSGPDTGPYVAAHHPWKVISLILQRN